MPFVCRIYAQGNFFKHPRINIPQNKLAITFITLIFKYIIQTIFKFS